MASTKWKPLTPRPFNWAMKPLDSADTGVKTLDDGRLELNIRHDILKGVTAAMLGWWFRNIDGTMEHMGQTYPRNLIWHPIDHIHYEVARRSPEGTAGPGVRFLIVVASSGLLSVVDVGPTRHNHALQQRRVARAGLSAFRAVFQYSGR